MRCEGWRRYGGALTLGPVEWKQCKEEAIVMIETEQESKITILPGCLTCWNECIENNIQIRSVTPIHKDKG